jgi:voltage-gated potassium channel
MESASNELTPSRRELELQPYDFFMLLLCVYSLMSLSAETFLGLSQETRDIVDAVDNVVCGIFLLDFFINLGRAKDRFQFMKWGWIDLLSSIPAIDFLQAGRIVRVIRILRVLRGIRLARILANYLKNNRADGAFLAVIFIAILLLFLSSIAILQVEVAQDSNIKTPSDALWWAIVTMTTVGYGDKFPTTTIGRIIASVLMVSGVGLFGTLSGSVASWILNPVEQRQDVDLNAIHAELALINRRLNETTSISPNVPDSRLNHLIAAWPNLSESKRNAIARIIE